MWIMIAGPYRSGAGSDAEREDDLGRLNRLALEVFRKGHVPVIGVNMALPVIRAAAPGAASAAEDVYDEVMMPLSLALADRCDAILRAPGASAGADREVERMRARGGPVYDSIEDVPDARARAAATPRDVGT